jgi:hypothetical protein
MTFVPGANLDRTSFTVVNRGQEVWFTAVKVEERIKARITWVTSDTTAGGGTTLCWLTGLVEVGRKTSRTDPVRYMMYFIGGVARAGRPRKRLRRGRNRSIMISEFKKNEA